MANEFTPEIDAQVLEAIKRKIADDEALRIASARGEATARGLSGGSFEARRVGDATRGAQAATADAMVNMALQRATMQREERLRQQEQAYGSAEAEKARLFGAGESEKQRSFTAEQTKLNQQHEGSQVELNRQYQSLENEKQRAYASGEADKARLYEQQQAEIQRQFNEAQNAENNRQSLIGAGIEGGAGLIGQIIGRSGMQKFQNPETPPPGLFSPTGVANVGKSFLQPGSVSGAGSTLGSVAGVGAGLFGGGMAGQQLAKLTGKNTREAKAGSALGAGLGTLFGGPIGGVLGGAAGGLAAKGIQGVGKAAKKLFCFLPSTYVEMADGSNKIIKDIQLGDETRGGIVESVRTAITGQNTLYRYCGVVVTGSHAVKEDGKWVRVENSNYAEPIPGTSVVYSLVTTGHRVYVNHVTFADEHETDYYEQFTLDQSLDYLNEQEKLAEVR